MTTPNGSGKKIFQVLVRFVFVAFCIVTYFLAVFFAFEDPFSLFLFLPVTAGLIAGIVAGGAFQVAHHRIGRPVLEVILFALYPFLNYYLVFWEIDFGTRSLWIFCGFYYFLTITIGFVLGIFIAPFATDKPGCSRGGVFKAIKDGIEFIKSMKLLVYGLFLLALIVVAAIVFFLPLADLIEGVSDLQKLLFYLPFLAALFFFVKFTSRHTFFGSGYEKVIKENRDE